MVRWLSGTGRLGGGLLAAAGIQQKQWSPRWAQLVAWQQFSSAPAPVAATTATSPAQDLYKVRLTVKSFENRFATEAARVLHDLMIITLPPRGLSALPGQAAPMSPLRLSLPSGAASIPQKITRFTVLRSPHVDKKSREQFERRVYKRSLLARTTSLAEVGGLILMPAGRNLFLMQLLACSTQENMSLPSIVSIF